MYPPSPSESHPCPPPPPEAAPPPVHDLPSQRDAGTSIHAAPPKSAQSERHRLCPPCKFVSPLPTPLPPRDPVHVAQTAQRYMESIYSGVCSFCGAWQRSGTSPCTKQRRVSPVWQAATKPHERTPRDSTVHMMPTHGVSFRGQKLLPFLKQTAAPHETHKKRGQTYFKRLVWELVTLPRFTRGPVQVLS